MKISLEGKKVFITGGSSGIGEAMVVLFRESGADVFFTYHKSAANAERIASKYSAVAIKCDVSRPDFCLSAIEKVLNARGRIDVLVNNAGIYLNAMTDAPDFPEVWRQVIAVNLNSCACLIHAVVPGMKKNGGGRIINISSIHAVDGTTGAAAYHSAKAGLDGLTRACAVELAPYNILVNSINPGPINTPMWNDGDNIYKTEIAEMVPLRRFGEPEEIAGAAVFLASDYAGYITGQSLFIDGGLLINVYKE